MFALCGIVFCIAYLASRFISQSRKNGMPTEREFTEFENEKMTRLALERRNRKDKL